MAQGVEDIDARLRSSTVQDRRKKIRSLVNGMACDDATEAVSNDQCAARWNWDAGLVRGQLLKKLLEFP